ncbi:gluconokinase [Jannaschia sp. LMIT008]|uniref:gluconokinase n=1 Tax=Jannaschia maritima TaxID=3032585 RepID=UPI0028126872|nr:gluconokinase [Jannaschia sp. LMIT008]
MTGAPTRIVVMGVTSTGKSRTGARLARVLGLPFVDGDDLHPRRNRIKMAGGTPLDDTDRRPWLDRIGIALAERPRVVACSALKRRYRDRIRSHAGEVLFVHLHGPRAVIARRMAAREGHFMPVSLLDSQLATLEAPGPDEWVVRADIRRDPRAIVAGVLDRLRRPWR